MSNLQFLKVHGYRDSLQLTGGLSYISHKLRLLHWKYYPMTCFPCNVNLEFLVELIMLHSKLEKLWEGNKVSFFLTSFQIQYLYIFELEKTGLVTPVCDGPDYFTIQMNIRVLFVQILNYKFSKWFIQMRFRNLSLIFLISQLNQSESSQFSMEIVLSHFILLI